MKLNRFILVHLVRPFENMETAELDLVEMRSLIETSGGATVVRVIQRRMRPDSATYVGSGKAQEITQFIKDERINVIVINDIVKPGALFNLQKIVQTVNPDIEVWDRVDLILDIFQKHALTAEAKLQIELANMRHMGPRIFGMGLVLSRQTGGIGGRGIGETNTELMKRHWRKQTAYVQEKLEKLRAGRMSQIERRKENGIPTVSIVGYTNAGKSALFNLLTSKNKTTENILFATLDTTSGSLYMSKLGKKILFTDTIGFIQKLPPELIDAFKSTLIESIHADLLLHVIDASDPKMYDKIRTVQGILASLLPKPKPMIFVFSKIDKAPDLNRAALEKSYAQYAPQFVSPLSGEGIKNLVGAIEERLRTYALRYTPGVE